jgi:hypothetical protein
MNNLLNIRTSAELIAQIRKANYDLLKITPREVI